MGEPTPNEANGGRTVDEAIERYLRSLDAGGSRDTLRWVLADGDTSFLCYLRSEGIERVSEIDVETIREWAFELRERSIEGELAASTAHNYFAYVRAFLSFAVRDGLIATNPAEPARAQEFLPEDTGERDRQFWSEADRDALLSFVTQRCDRAHERESDIDLTRAYRDRALVVLLALTGVRGAEILRDPNDEKRNGLYWSDVDLESGTLTVLGKAREYETVGLTEDTPDGIQATLPPLDRWYRVQDPPTDDWPVFPTGHYPSKRRALETAVGETRADDILTDSDVDSALRECETAPPSISKNGGRRIMQRLCEEASLDIDGEYLKPHGGRRGLGHALYRRGHALEAQEMLRHQSVRTTKRAYSDLDARQTAQSAAETLADDRDD